MIRKIIIKKTDLRSSNAEAICEILILKRGVNWAAATLSSPFLLAPSSHSHPEFARGAKISQESLSPFDTLSRQSDMPRDKVKLRDAEMKKAQFYSKTFPLIRANCIARKNTMMNNGDAWGSRLARKKKSWARRVNFNLHVRKGTFLESLTRILHGYVQ